MTCEQIEHDEIAEQYLSGRLPGADQDRFEAHYFDCARCQERLRALEDARITLGREAAGWRGQSAPQSGATARSRRLAWRLAGAGLAAAAVVTLAVRIIGIPDAESTAASGGAAAPGADVTLPVPPSAPPARDLRALARFQPPPYEPLRLRATTTQAQREFRGAMELYVAGDYHGAAAGLRRAVELDPSLVAANFYLGICTLQGDQTLDAVVFLQRVVTVGESPYLEDAHFFLAKARIRQGDVPAARSELTQVVTLDGDRRAEARQILAQLP